MKLDFTAAQIAELECLARHATGAHVRSRCWPAARLREPR